MIVRVAALAALAVAAGCDDDAGVPSTLLTGPRLLAIAASPPVTTIAGTVALDALVVDADGTRAAVEVAWRACSPWRLVRDPDVDCRPDQALALAAGDDGVVRLEVAAVLARFGAPAGAPPPPGPCDLTTVSIPVIATAWLGDTVVRARKDVGIAVAPRGAPAIAAVTLDGGPATRFAASTEHRLAATPARDRLELRCTDDPEPAQALESVRAYFYVTAGALDATSASVTYAPDGSEVVGTVGFTGPDQVEAVRLWTVLIDGDGGVAWALRELRVAP